MFLLVKIKNFQYKLTKKQLNLLSKALILLIASLIILASSQSKPSKDEFITVVRVIDGDTIEISTGEKIRYIGIDAPEDTTKKQCFGVESTKKNIELVLNKEIRIEKDKSDKDRYGRLLRYVYVGDQFINKILVNEGYAKSKSYPPDTRYQEAFDNAELYAKNNNLGLWGKCENDKSSD